MSKMPKLDIDGLPIDTRTNYPPPFDRVVHGRERRRLGNARASASLFGKDLSLRGGGRFSLERALRSRLSFLAVKLLLG